MSTKKTAQKKSPWLKELDQAKKANPYFDQTLLHEMVEDANNYHSLKVLCETEGGQVLVDTLIKDVVASISKLENYDSMTRDQIIAVIARMVTSLNTARALTRAAENLEYVDEALDEALR